MKLTKDERMMAMLYGDGTRGGLISALQEMQAMLQEDEQELRIMSNGLLAKLEGMTDETFREVTDSA